jgi:hypothetical protein
MIEVLSRAKAVADLLDSDELFTNNGKAWQERVLSFIDLNTSVIEEKSPYGWSYSHGLVDKGDVIFRLFEDVQDEPFSYTLDSVTPKFDGSDLFPEPAYIDDPKIYFQNRSWYKDKCKPGHFLRPEHTTVVMLSTLIHNFKFFSSKVKRVGNKVGIIQCENPILRKASYYFKWLHGRSVKSLEIWDKEWKDVKRFRFGKKDQFPPFLQICFQSRDGTIEINPNDLMSPVRWLLCLNAALNYEIFQLKLKSIKVPKAVKDAVMKAQVEVFEFLFKNPFVNAKKLKSLFGPIKSMLCALQVGGTRINWTLTGQKSRSPQASQPRPGKMPSDYPQKLKYQDHVIESIHREAGVKAAKELSELGLKTFAGLREFWTKGKPEHVIPIWVWFENLLGAPGFTRSDTIDSVTSQVHDPLLSEDTLKHVRELEPDFKMDFPVKKYLHEEWTRFAHWFSKRVESTPKMFRNFINSLTSRGAGGLVERMNVMIKGSKFPIRLSNKRGLFYMLGLKETFSEKKFALGYTEQFPGKIGIRDTVGRNRRGIMMMRLNSFANETLIGTYVNDYIKEAPQDYKFGTSSDFPTGNQRGILLVDHAIGLALSATGEYYIVGEDYSQFDRHQEYQPIRVTAMNALTTAFNSDQVFTEPFGPIVRRINGKPIHQYQNWADYITKLWSPKQRRDAVFEVRDFNHHRPGMIWDASGGNSLLQINSVLSGEFMTLSFNGLTNRALQRSHRAKESYWKEELDFTYTQIVGDDVVGLFKKLVDEPTKEAITDYLQSRVLAAAHDGQELNKLKIDFRKFFYTFLKIRCLYGFLIPQTQIQIIASERPKVGYLPVQTMTGYSSIISLAVERGFPMVLMRRLRYFTWLLMSRVRHQPPGGYPIEFYPYENALYGPHKIGLPGCHPKALVGASYDALVYDTYKNNKEIKDQVNGAAYLFKTPEEKLADAIVSELILGRGTRISHDKGPQMKVDGFRNGIRDYANLIPNSVKQRAASAISVLEKEYPGAPPLGNMSLLKAPVAGARANVQNIGEIAKIRNKERLNLMVKPFPNEPPNVVDQEFDWVFFLKLERKARVERVFEGPTPWITCDETLQESVRVFDASGRSPSVLDPNSLDKALRRNEYFGSYITAEQVIDYLSRPYFLTRPKSRFFALVGMGVEPANANKLINSMSGGLGSYEVAKASKGFSFSGSFTSNLKFDAANMKRFTNSISYGMEPIRVLLTDFCSYKSFLEGQCTGVYHRWNISKETDQQSFVKAVTQGRLSTSVLAHSQVYPL